MEWILWVDKWMNVRTTINLRIYSHKISSHKRQSEIRKRKSRVITREQAEVMKQMPPDRAVEIDRRFAMIFAESMICHASQNLASVLMSRSIIVPKSPNEEFNR